MRSPRPALEELITAVKGLDMDDVRAQVAAAEGSERLATANLGRMARRDEILSTAAELFAARGFHGVSVADIGAACGISGPALYKHFASKDAVLAEMLVSISERLLEVGRERSEAAPDARAALVGAGRVARRLRPAGPAADRRPGPRLGVAAR